jgi:hypothetical protein
MAHMQKVETAVGENQPLPSLSQPVRDRLKLREGQNFTRQIAPPRLILQ